MIRRMTPPNVVYLVLAHANPSLVTRLTERLLAGDEGCHVVVDHEAGGSSREAALPSGPRVHQRSSSRPGGWGGFGLVTAVTAAFADVRRELDPDWIVLLSGQDYPARPPGEIHAELMASSADCHLTLLHRIPAHSSDVAMRWWLIRYFYRWWAMPRLPRLLPEGLRVKRLGLQRRLSMAQDRIFIWSLPRGSGTKVGLRRRRTPFGADYPCWSGYQWMAVSRRGLEAIEAELARRPELTRLYARSVIPDESMLHTVLLNAPALTVSQPSLTFQRPSGPGDAHAADLTLDDLPEIEASGRAFARKMHPVASAALMDALDRRIGASGPA